jgi:cation diffusion facilitator CzcD-associated flavoprotein CzcO
MAAIYSRTNRQILAVDGHVIILGTEEGNTDEQKEMRIPADVIILANGFSATCWLQPFSVYGRNSTSLYDVWKARGGPAAYMGLSIDGFPNFFIAVGPNTANEHHSLILTTANTVSYILKMLRPILRGEIDQVEVKKSAVIWWTVDVEKGLQKTVFVGCRRGSLFWARRLWCY